MQESNHSFIRPGQVSPDRPAPDRCMQCGAGEAGHQSPASAGPFGTERQALDLPEVRAAYASIAGPGTGDLECVRIIETALTAAGVELGAYDRRIVNWLGGWEAQMCAVIAGLIYRAHATVLSAADRAVVLGALEDAAKGNRERAAWCRDCEAAPEWLCQPCGERLDAAVEYEHLATRMRQARP